MYMVMVDKTLGISFSNFFFVKTSVIILLYMLINMNINTSFAEIKCTYHLRKLIN